MLLPGQNIGIILEYLTKEFISDMFVYSVKDSSKDDSLEALRYYSSNKTTTIKGLKRKFVFFLLKISYVILNVGL